MKFVLAIALFVAGVFAGAGIMGSSYQKVQYRPVDVLMVDWNDNQVLKLEPIGRARVEGDLVERLRNLGFTAGLVEVNCTGPMEMRFARIDENFYSLNGASQHPAFAVMNYGGQSELRSPLHSLSQPEDYVEKDRWVANELLERAGRVCPE